jgi:hypothetical protein
MKLQSTDFDALARPESDFDDSSRSLRPGPFGDEWDGSVSTGGVDIERELAAPQIVCPQPIADDPQPPA